ncbi:protein FAR1-RELATED SEQUENCE 5-like [Henckelia pumila]|uniref:protein FAR1-RELATED SEQUENCE 5-like n=1 Tax=Henckelia pumila TaxID=405737 RepID=UPI003C6E8C34
MSPQYENMTFIEKDCGNFIDKVRRLRLGKEDATAIHIYFEKNNNQSPGFYFSIDYDEDGRLKNIFWADKRCRLAYKEFGDVVTFDTTYLTNNYDMPFSPFLGVNNHGQSTLLGCGLIAGEDTDTFVWLFQTCLDCMENQPPKESCLKSLGITKKKDSIFKDIHNYVYESLNPEEFVQSWFATGDKYNLHENDCESMNAFFDGYVHSKTNLTQFVEQYERALSSKLEKEFQADFHSYSQLIPCVSAYDIEKQFQASYTMDKFREF